MVLVSRQLFSEIIRRYFACFVVVFNRRFNWWWRSIWMTLGATISTWKASSQCTIVFDFNIDSSNARIYFNEFRIEPIKSTVFVNVHEQRESMANDHILSSNQLRTLLRKFRHIIFIQLFVLPLFDAIDRLWCNQHWSISMSSSTWKWSAKVEQDDDTQNQATVVVWHVVYVSIQWFVEQDWKVGVRNPFRSIDKQREQEEKSSTTTTTTATATATAMMTSCHSHASVQLLDRKRLCDLFREQGIECVEMHHLTCDSQ
jgi:hypothetical protein